MSSSSVERSGPVTFGQLSVIRSMGLYARTGGLRAANLVNLWRLPNGTDLPDVCDAWDALIITHESLRTTYDFGGTELIQRVHPFRRTSMPVVEVIDTSLAAAATVSEPLADAPIDVTTELPTRVAVAADDGEPAYLVTVIHHLAADAGALEILERQLGARLAGIEPNRPVPQPIDVALIQRNEETQYAVDHWATRWQSFGPSDRNTDDFSRRRRASIYRIDALDAARTLGGRAGVSGQSVLMFVGAAVISRVLGRAELSFGLMAANRLDDRWAEMVSSLNQCVPVRLALESGAPPEAALRAVHLTALEAYANASFDVDRLRVRLAADGVEDDDPTFFSSHFNFLGAMADEPAAAAPIRHGVEWRPSTQRSGPNLHLAIATGAGLRIGVGASEDLLPGDLPATCALAIADALLRLAEGDIDPLASLGVYPPNR